MIRHVLAAALLLVPLSDAVAAAPPARSTIRGEVESFMKSYIEAVNRKDIAALMEMTSRRPEVSTISDGEISRGWEQIRADADRIVGVEGTFKFKMGEVDVVSLGAAYALAYAPYTVTVGTDRGTMELASAMSLVLEKSGDRWRILHDHMSTKLEGEPDGD